MEEAPRLKGNSNLNPVAAMAAAVAANLRLATPANPQIKQYRIRRSESNNTESGDLNQTIPNQKI